MHIRALTTSMPTQEMLGTVGRDAVQSLDPIESSAPFWSCSLRGESVKLWICSFHLQPDLCNGMLCHCIELIFNDPQQQDQIYMIYSLGRFFWTTLRILSPDGWSALIGQVASDLLTKGCGEFERANTLDYTVTEAELLDTAPWWKTKRNEVRTNMMLIQVMNGWFEWTWMDCLEIRAGTSTKS